MSFALFRVGLLSCIKNKPAKIDARHGPARILIRCGTLKTISYELIETVKEEIRPDGDHGVDLRVDDSFFPTDQVHITKAEYTTTF